MQAPRRRIVRAAAIVAVVVAPLVAIPAGPAHALTSCAPSVRTSVWDGGAATSDWNDAANWNPDGVPTPADHVCINVGTGVTVASATVQSIESQKPLTITASLTVTSTAQGSTLGATTLAASASLGGAGNTTLVGTLDWVEGGTVNGPGTLTIATGGTLRMPNQTCVNHRFLTGPLLNHGTINYADTCTISLLFSNGTIDNHGAITISDNASWANNGGTNSIHNETDGTITGNGTSTSSPGTLAIALDNDGVVTSTSGALNVGGTQPPGSFETGAFTAAAGGTLALQNLELFGTPTLGAPPAGGTVTIRSATSNPGSGATVPSGQTLDWEQGGTVNGPGTLTIATGGTLRMPNQTCVNHRFLTGPLLNHGTINYADTCTISLLFSNGTIDNHGAITISDNASWANNGGTNSIHNETDGTITGNGTSTSSPGTLAIALDNDGVVTSTSGALNVGGTQPPGSFETGAFTAAAGGTLALQNLELFGTPTLGAPPAGGTVTIRSATSNPGSGATVPSGQTLDWEQGGTLNGPGTLTIAAGGTLRMPNQTCVNHRFLTGPLLNHGTINYADTCTISLLFSNGTIDNHGAITISDNASWANNGGTNSIHNETDGTITGNGTSTSSPGTLSVAIDNDGAITSPPGSTLVLPALHLSGGHGTIGAPTGGTVTVLSLDIDASASPTVPSGQTLDWVEGGTVNGPGTLTIATGGTLRMPNQTCVNHRFLTGPLLNHGTINYADTCTISLLFSNGTIDNHGAITISDNASWANNGGTNSIHNETDGTITGNGTSTRTIGVLLDNDGSVTSAGGALMISNISGYNPFTQMLSGGVWAASGTGALSLPQVNGISVLDATMSRDGPSAAIRDSQNLDPLRALTTITSNGGLTVRTGASLTTPGPLTTAGAVHIGALAALTSTGLYTQTGGSTTIEHATGALTALGSLVELHGGTLAGKGQVQSDVQALGGTINPTVGNVPTGGAGILQVNGAVSLDATSGFAASINGTTAGGNGVGLGYPQLTTNGALHLGGTLTLSKGAAYAPVDGTTFTLATGASLTGAFDTIVADSSFAGWVFTATNTATAARVTIHQGTGPPLPTTVTATVPPGGTLFTAKKATPEDPTIVALKLPKRVAAPTFAALRAGNTRAAPTVTPPAVNITLSTFVTGIETFCGGLPCFGKLIDITPFAGYTDRKHPVKLTMTWDRSVVRNGVLSTLYVRKEATPATATPVPACIKIAGAIQRSPCIQKTKLLKTGDLQSVVLLLSGDPRFARR